jgi:hypothetical protein
VKVVRTVALGVSLIVAAGIGADCAYAFRLPHSGHPTHVGRGTVRPHRVVERCGKYGYVVSRGHCCPKGTYWRYNWHGKGAGQCVR